MQAAPTAANPAGDHSHRGLDGVNFCVAAMQTGFGAFITVYLVQSQWPPQAIGLALTVATMSGVFSQMPAGAFIDSIRDKRRPVLFGVIGLGVAALLLCVTAERAAVYAALAVQGLASSLIGPGIAGMSLTLVGQAALSERVGRNARFASIGNGLAAAVMGIAGSWLSAVSVFLVAAVLALPALLSLSFIDIGRLRRQPAAPALAAGECPDEARLTWEGMKVLLVDRRLAIFAVCVVLFFAASAAIGPGVAAAETRRRPEIAALVVAATILIPQAIVAAISPWIGRTAETMGRKPLLLVGWGLLPLQAVLYAALPFPVALVVGNLLNAGSAAVFGVMMTVVVADLTRRSGCFNLTLGALGVAMSIGASLSTFFTGLGAAALGGTAAALGLAFVGVCGLVLLWAGMPETRPAAE